MKFRALVILGLIAVTAIPAAGAQRKVLVEYFSNDT